MKVEMLLLGRPTALGTGRNIHTDLWVVPDGGRRPHYAHELIIAYNLVQEGRPMSGRALHPHAANIMC